MTSDFGFCRWQRRGNAKEPRHHPLNIAINDNTRLAKGNRANGTSCIGTNTGKRAKIVTRLREPATPFISNEFGRFVQVGGTGVISQPSPGSKNIIQWCASQILDPWPAAYEVQKIGNDRGDNSLLQHNLRQPDMIGGCQLRPAPPPWKIAPMLVIPGKQSSRCKNGLSHGPDSLTSAIPNQPVARPLGGIARPADFVL